MKEQAQSNFIKITEKIHEDNSNKENVLRIKTEIVASIRVADLAESGLRSRPEITDAIMGQRAECVMLNNGTHIVEAVKTLAALLSTEERHQIKKHQLFREFTVQHDIFEDKD